MKNQRIIIALLAFLGLFVSAELCYVFYNANFVPNAAPSFCTINNVIDCDAVSKSGFSTFLGVPLSFYGLLFYSFIMFLALFPFQKYDAFKNFKNPESYIFTLSTVSVIFSVILAVISMTIIHKVCILCIVLYDVNFLLLVFSKLGKPVLSRYKESFTDLINILSDKRWIAIVILTVLIAIGLLITINMTNIFMPPKENKIIPSSEKEAIELRKMEMMERLGMPQGNIYQPTGNILGAKNPRLVIKEFTDFQCPFCSISNSMMYRLVNEVDGIRVEHHDFPISNECNPIVPANIHKFSCNAAYYARAAKMQGKYWDYITLLFDNQQELSEEKFIELAKQINLDTDRLKRDAQSEEVKRAVTEDVEIARDLHIDATPTYIIGIKKYVGIMPYPVLKETVIKNMK